MLIKSKMPALFIALTNFFSLLRCASPTTRAAPTGRLSSAFQIFVKPVAYVI